MNIFLFFLENEGIECEGLPITLNNQPPLCSVPLSTRQVWLFARHHVIIVSDIRFIGLFAAASLLGHQPLKKIFDVCFELMTTLLSKICIQSILIDILKRMKKEKGRFLFIDHVSAYTDRPLP
jgi:hypothetical protein